MHRLLVDSLGVTHLKAVVGFSMGAQQAFQWAVSYPDFMDRAVATSGTAKTYPHGVVRLEGQIAAIAADQTFNGGDYTAPPTKGLEAFAVVWTAWLYSQEWWRRELWRAGAPAGTTFAQVLENYRTHFIPGADANDLILQMRTWEHHDVGATPGMNGDVERALRSIRVPFLYMPSETDLYFPLGDARYEQAFIPHVHVRADSVALGAHGRGGEQPRGRAIPQHDDRPVPGGAARDRRDHAVTRSLIPTMRLLPCLVAALLAGVPAVAPAAAQAPTAERAALDSAFTRQEVMMPMRDGVRLFTVILTPRHAPVSGALPIILSRTPYGTDNWGGTSGILYGFHELMQDGYIFAFQDIRGRHQSEGAYVMNHPPQDHRNPKAIDESTDAYDTIDWLVKHVPNNNGRVGELGISYPGWLTNMATIDPAPRTEGGEPAGDDG